MNYIVLARKWRPQLFNEVVGQDYVLKALINGLSLNKIHHAYLFSGTRGTGKTTIARLLAKSLSCKEGIKIYPCRQCENCIEIESGNFIDLIEIDAASKTKVEDIRDILDSINYTPVKGIFKIYLIDEIHMLSRYSFNALLKSLEEPPSYVKFLLATTDYKKLPTTILSRCFQLHLNPININQIVNKLSFILKKENIIVEKKALEVIAQYSYGSMRDALNLTDQAISLGKNKISTEMISYMLGSLSKEQSINIIELLFENKFNYVMIKLKELNSNGVNWENFLVELLSLLHCIIIKQITNNYLNFEENKNINLRLQKLANTIPTENLQNYYTILLNARKNLFLSPNPRIGVEVALLNILYKHKSINK